MTKEELRSHLEEIRAHNDGLLTRRDVWMAAKEETHPLHQEFDWDLKSAAENWWDEQAGRLIRRVTVVETVHSINVTVPVYAHDPRLPPGESGYRPISTLRTEEDTAKLVLFDELDRVIFALRRARAVAVVLGLHEELEALLLRVGSFRQHAEETRDPSRDNA